MLLLDDKFTRLRGVLMKTNLRHWRNKRVLSIKMLAERADVAPATIVNIEKEKHTPNPETLHKLAKALAITVDKLVEEEVSTAHSAA